MSVQIVQRNSDLEGTMLIQIVQRGGYSVGSGCASGVEFGCGYSRCQNVEKIQVSLINSSPDRSS